MKKGMLIYDSSTNRFDVLYEEGNSYGGLHCGTAMEALIDANHIRGPCAYADFFHSRNRKGEST